MVAASIASTPPTLKARCRRCLVNRSVDVAEIAVADHVQMAVAHTAAVAGVVVTPVEDEAIVQGEADAVVEDHMVQGKGICKWRSEGYLRAAERAASTRK